MNNLDNKVAIITGGTKGIGYGIAEAMIEAGMRVAITSRTQAAATEAAEKLNQIRAKRAIGIEADVRDYPAQVEAVTQTLEAFGQVDVMIANAGVGHFASIADLEPNQWKDTIDINLTGVFYSVKAVLEALEESKGYFISIASLAGTNFFAGGAAYNASKFGLVGFTQAIMLDLRQKDIKVSTIMPGSVSTHFNGNEPDKSDNWKIQPEDIGQIVLDLLKMPARTLPSKVEVRPTKPPKK